MASIPEDECATKEPPRQSSAQRTDAVLAALAKIFPELAKVGQRVLDKDETRLRTVPLKASRSNNAQEVTLKGSLSNTHDAAAHEDADALLLMIEIPFAMKLLQDWYPQVQLLASMLATVQFSVDYLLDDCPIKPSVLSMEAAGKEGLTGHVFCVLQETELVCMHKLDPKELQKQQDFELTAVAGPALANGLGKLKTLRFDPGGTHRFLVPLSNLVIRIPQLRGCGTLSLPTITLSIAHYGDRSQGGPTFAPRLHRSASPAAEESARGVKEHGPDKMAKEQKADSRRGQSEDPAGADAAKSEGHESTGRQETQPRSRGASSGNPSQALLERPPNPSPKVSYGSTGSATGRPRLSSFIPNAHSKLDQGSRSINRLGGPKSKDASFNFNRRLSKASVDTVAAHDEPTSEWNYSTCRSLFEFRVADFAPLPRSLTMFSSVFDLNLMRTLLLESFVLDMEQYSVPPAKSAPPGDAVGATPDTDPAKDTGLQQSGNDASALQIRCHCYMPTLPRMIARCMRMFVGKQVEEGDMLRLCKDLLVAAGLDFRNLEKNLLA